MLTSADQQFDELVGRVLNSTWKFYPDRAAKEGLHDYDGGMTDVSTPAIATRVRDLDTHLAQLHRLDDELLSDSRRFDRRVLISALRKEKFGLTELKIYQRNPMDALDHIDLSSYVLRDYAPAEERVEALTTALGKVPDYVNTLRSNIDADIGKPIIEASIEAYEGMQAFYETDLVMEVRRLGAQAAFGQFDTARRAASQALGSFVAHLRSRLSTAPMDFAIGATNFQWMLEYGEMIDLPINELQRIGEQDLHRNLIQLRKLASEITPNGDVATLLRETKQNHPAASMLIPETSNMLDSIRQFIVDNDLLSIPSSIRCTVKETPAFMRWAFAAMDLPGTFETNATEAYYYITPVDRSWTDVQKDEWLSSFNYPLLKDVSIHEAYPGHYVHHLHSKNASSKLSLVFGAYSFWEGWAHYAEEMMIEQGFGWNDKRVHLMQLMEALLRDCRFLCSIRMHTQGMTVEEAKRFFIEYAYLEELPAEREAMRGTFDPMYLNYTLGKLQLMKLREEYKLLKGRDFSLKTFHDTLLSFGAPPIPLIREAVLGERGGSPL
jgi:uncharacterized protein (DUF885 family)